MGWLKQLVRRCCFGVRSDSERYIRYLRSLGMRIGEQTVIYDPRSVLIDETRPWMIEIGDNVQITRGVTILTHGYDWSVLKGVYGDVLGSCGKVTIGDHVFLGVNAVILKGVSIGSNVILGAGSVVTKDIPANTVAAGNPARVIMTLEEYRRKRKAAQAAEARALVEQYRKVYGKDPDERTLSEFFWLFTDDDSSLPAVWEEKMQLAGSRTFSGISLREHEKQYGNLQEFLDSCSK